MSEFCFFQNVCLENKPIFETQISRSKNSPNISKKAKALLIFVFQISENTFVTTQSVPKVYQVLFSESKSAKLTKNLSILVIIKTMLISM